MLTNKGSCPDNMYPPEENRIKKMARHRRRPKPLVPFCLFFFFVLLQYLVVAEARAASYWRDSSIGAKRYTLYGTIDLTYERDWTEDSNTEAINTFTQTYDLGVRGFVIDPRLVNFDVAGSYTNTSSNSGVDFTLQGVRLNAIILEELPRTAARKVLKYFPNPIHLRFTDYSNAYNYRNYGVSLQYAVPEEILFYKKKDESGRSNRLHVPIFYFDYDNYSSSSGNSRISTDIYSFRAAMTGEHYDHRLLYEVQDQTGTVKYKRETFELLPTYRFYDDKTRRSIDIFNSLRFEKIEDTKYLTVHVLPRYYEPMGPEGKDIRQLTGSFDYSKITSPTDSTEAYSTAVSAAYTKVISPRLTNTAMLSVGVGKSDSEELHFERISNSVQTDLTRTLGATGSVILGNSERGEDYGAEAFLYTKTRVRTTAGYSFSSVPELEGRTVNHRFYLTAAGPLLRTASFDTTAQYVVRDVSGTASPFGEDLFFYGANLYWYLGKTSFTLGGTYAQTITRTDQERATSYLFLYSNISRYLTPRTFLNVYSTWEQDNNDVKRFELRPSINWRRGLTLLDLEYNYTWASRGDDPSTEPTRDHRIMVRLIRDLFYTIYRP